MDENKIPMCHYVLVRNLRQDEHVTKWRKLLGGTLAPKRLR